MKTLCSRIAIVVMVLVATSAWGEGDGKGFDVNSFIQSVDAIGASGPSACDGSNASDVCVLDDSDINSVVCIRSDVVKGVTKLKYTANKATCGEWGGSQHLTRYWCANGHTVKKDTITCDAGDSCFSGQCHHYDEQTKIKTSYPFGTNTVGYAELYGSTEAGCSKQDNALQNICKTVDTNKGIETQFPSAWSRLKYYGGCK